ncbi:metallophosphoesterase [Opitutus sp. ER46]|uniref:metallophosphoesterase n=1 Tax=Opitutus sp. ER46 TaxID=2161864 RepID=UPI000D2FF810|nr:metallophosphoesterase [Opitutus sp. ER46]PTX92481.1 hypothetical protein DB354_14190 [Opitutus sp. ER46]
MRIPLIIFLIVFSSLALTLLWWWWADTRLRTLRRAGWLRVAVGLFATIFLSGVTYYILMRRMGWKWSPPDWWVAVVMLWALIGLPLMALPLMDIAGIAWLVGWWRRRRRKSAHMPAAIPVAGEPALTRREALAAGMALAPMVLTLGTVGVGLIQNRRFRIRRIEVDLPQLPSVLDGMTIAHVSDSHVGKFTYGPIVDRIARATLELDADLTLFTGDLIDSRLEELPEAVAFLQRIHRPGRFLAIEGNHDLFGGREPFERAVRGAGLPLLLDEKATLRVRGHPVEVIGLRWSYDAAHPDPRNFGRVVAGRDPDAFPIVLAHHPHAFDVAAQAGLPLTLAGHTHGGQLMLTPEFGAGPMLFRYWSGLYRQGAARLVVSNGVGNWFPLRTAAPAEIVHLTLRAR